MMYRLALRLAPALAGFAVIACDDETTAPSPVTEEVAADPSLATTATTNEWITRANLPSTERIGPATAVLTSTDAIPQSVLYVLGGYSIAGKGSISKVQAYDVATNSWSYKTDMPVPVYRSNGAGVINGKIYISGGIMWHNGYSAALSEYNPATDTWTRKQDMPNSTFDGVTGVIGGRLYVLTGCYQEECVPGYVPQVFYRYDPATDQWETLPLPPELYKDVGGSLIGGTIGGKFYATYQGGEMFIYDPATNRWTIKTPANQPASISTGTTLQAKLYALTIQETHPDGTSTTVLSYYDPGTNAWTSLEPVRFDVPQGPLTKVQVNGSPRFELVGGPRPGNNMQYIP